MDSPDNIFGKTIESTGAELLRRLESGIGEGFLCSEELPSGNGPNIFGRPALYRRSAGLSFLAGLAGAGLRASAFLRGGELAANYAQLADLARQNLAAVIHYAPHGEQGKGQSPFGAYSDLCGAAETGCFQLFAANLQEMVDFAIIAHKVAELALLPGICVMGGLPTAYSKQEASLPEAAALRRFLGQADDQIACPTPAQRLIFGKTRRRIPQWFSFDMPMLHGARKDGLSLNLEGAARERYFYRHLPAIMQQAMEEYGRLTGRSYTGVRAFQAERAEYLILAQGAAFEALSQAAGQLQ